MEPLSPIPPTPTREQIAQREQAANQRRSQPSQTLTPDNFDNIDYRVLTYEQDDYFPPIVRSRTPPLPEVGARRRFRGATPPRKGPM